MKKEYWRFGTSILEKVTDDDGNVESRSLTEAADGAFFNQINEAIGEGGYILFEAEPAEEQAEEPVEPAEEQVEETTEPVAEQQEIVTQEEVNKLIEEKEMQVATKKKKNDIAKSFGTSLKEIEKRIEECKKELETLEKLREFASNCVELARTL